MATFKFLAMGNAVEGRDAEYNDWYSNQHLKDVLATPGVVGAQRYRLVAPQGQWSYLTIYELETDDAPALLAELGRRAGSELMPMSDASAKGGYLGVFEPI